MEAESKHFLKIIYISHLFKGFCYRCWLGLYFVSFGNAPGQSGLLATYHEWKQGLPIPGDHPS
jgi:hypothetical protein